MGHHQGFNRQHSRHGEQQWGMYGSRGRGPWGDWGSFGVPGGHPGPPPWVAGLFGLSRGPEKRGPRVRRGDVRAAILDVLRAAAETDEVLNGYQVIGKIAERSGDAWRPSPGSVYPTIQQLEDEGLVAADDEHGRRALSLTEEGRTYVAEHPDELGAVWKPFERPEREERSGGKDYADLKPEIGQVMGAVWQIVTQGSESQREAAVDVLVDTRRRLYGILADGDDVEEGSPGMSDQLRIGDVEREQAAADLGEHFAHGRLTADEHAERLDQVMRAKTQAELAPLFSDLPGGEYGARPAVTPPYAGRGDRSRRTRRMPRLPGPLFVLLAIVVAVAVVLHWPIFLIGLLVWAVFFKHRAWQHRC